MSEIIHENKGFIRDLNGVSIIQLAFIMPLQVTLCAGALLNLQLIFIS